ncbi:MAG: hypothetical protein ACOCRO_10440 [Halanaerobiales bacterium]
MRNIKNLYSKSSNGLFYTPFNIQIDSMKKLILINFEDDRDKYYKEFEIQQAHTDNKSPLLLIAYRNDGYVDIYHQPLYPLDSQSGVFANLEVYERPMLNAKFEVTYEKLEVYIFLKDKYDRDIELKVTESNRQKKKPFSLLAPIGSGSEKPLSLPIFILYEMAFTRKAYTDISIVVDGIYHHPNCMPLPVDCARNYLTRYSADTFIVDWNQKYKGPLSPYKPDDSKIIENKGVLYHLENNNGHFEIKKISAGNEEHQVNIKFSPSIPDLICLRDNIQLEGRFTISSDESFGSISGDYTIKRNNKIHISMCPTKGWKPHEKKLSMKLFYILAPLFKKWPSTYTWEAEIELSDDNNPIIDSMWRRVEGYKEKLNIGFINFDI